MKIIYLSPNYKTEDITGKYLHIDYNNNVIIEEINKRNLTIKSYILPESEYNKYNKEITEAENIKHHFPNCIKIKEV